MTSRAGIVSRIYWRILRLLGFGKEAWDDQFKKGLWSRGRHTDYFVEKIVSLSRGEFLIEFGCAEGVLLEELPEGSYSKYQGYDISGVAIELANKKAKENGLSNCAFEQCDMSEWVGYPGASLILLEECLYYLSPAQIKVFLDKCKRSLLPEGVILVVVHSAEKHASTLKECRLAGNVIEEVVINGRVFITLGK
jgi:cyclopropane fatty-acyl-phospholipid synthase-like methyltransferase